MSALDRKLLRDLWRMRLHAAAVMLVLACGLSVYVMAVGMRDTLAKTRAAYYAERGMADVAVNVMRAPDRVALELARVPGVAAIETRVSGLALLDIDAMVEPASARIVSLPREGRPRVNDLVLRKGRWPDPRRPEEALINEAFATALGVEEGDRLAATLHGRRQWLRIVGVANGPEFIFIAAPGELFPQPERFGVLWMGHEALARAYDMDGAFNDAVARLGPDADEGQVRRAFDDIMRSYGSTGAYGRDRMISDRFLTEELRQLATMAVFLPAFFLTVAAFLVNISLGRVIATERSNIGLMKAFGYSDGAVASHYLKSALVMACAGALIGSALGVWFGRGVSQLYQRYYHFPALDYVASPETFLGAWAAGLGAAGLGALIAVWRAAKLAPAAALAPPRPIAFHRGGGFAERYLEKADAKTRIIARRILRYPRRAATTMVGIALAIALLILARSFPAVMDHLLRVQFSEANRQAVTLSFIEPREAGVLHEVVRLPGVLYAEPARTDDMTFRFGGREAQEALIGIPRAARLSRVVDQEGRAIAVSASGVMLSRGLAERLGAREGDVIEIEQKQGLRISARVAVSSIVRPMLGSSAYMEMNAMTRLFREPGRITGAHVAMDAARHDDFARAVKRTPALIGASFVKLAERSMRANYDRQVGFMIGIYSLFAAVMAGGVAFSSARVTLAEQERDLATLRVLGFTRGEASYMLMGEIALLALAAAPIGCVLGAGLSIWLMRLFRTEMYDFPWVFDPSSFAFAIVFTLSCVAAAAFVVRGGVDRLDLVGVLKSRD